MSNANINNNVVNACLRMMEEFDNCCVVASRNSENFVFSACRGDPVRLVWALECAKIKIVKNSSVSESEED